MHGGICAMGGEAKKAHPAALSAGRRGGVPAGGRWAAESTGTAPGAAGGAVHGRRRGAVCGGTAGVGGAAASPSAPGPGGAAAGHAGAAGGLRLQAAGTLPVTGQCGAAGLPARRGRYGGGRSAGPAGKVSVAAAGPGAGGAAAIPDWERAVRWRSWRYASAQRRRGFPPC